MVARKKKKTGPVGRVSVGGQTEMINLVGPGNLGGFAVIEMLATVSGEKVGVGGRVYKKSDSET